MHKAVLALLVLAVVAPTARLTFPNANARAAPGPSADRMLRAHAFAPVNSVATEGSSGVYSAYAGPGCAKPLLIGVFYPSQLSQGSAADIPGYRALFTHYGWRSARFDFFAVMREGAVRFAGWSTGLAPYGLSPQVLVIQQPEGCQSATDLPWLSAWAPVSSV